MTDTEFSKLHAEHTPRMLAFLRSKPEWCGHAHLFDDAVQCAWCAFLKLPAQRQATATASFLITLAKNKLIDLIRHSEANHRMHEKLLDQANHEPATWDQSPIESIGADITKVETLAKFLPILKPRERVAVELFAKGLNSAESGAQMGISRQAVDQILARGLKKLRCKIVGRDVSEADRRRSKPGMPKGVGFHKGSQKFRARIEIEGKTVHLGYFTTIEAACSAYSKAAEKAEA